MKIFFLGTGGSWPTRERNPSAVAVSFGSWSILLDCGEGTQKQILSTSLSPMKIDLILISHLHGDHFLGVPGLVQSMSLNDRQRPLLIVGPQGLDRSWEYAMRMCYFSPRYPVNTLEMEHGNEFIFKDHRISVIQAIHSIPSLSYRIDEPMRRGRFNRTRASEMGIPEGPLWGKLQRGEEINYQKDGEILRAVPGDVMGPPRKGLSLVYSGDTAPNAELIEMARDADVLIHEATFGRRFSDLASEFGHTTAGDASRIGLEAGVKNLFLFHFSPRYSDPDSFREIEVEAREIFPDANFPDDGDIYEITH